MDCTVIGLKGTPEHRHRKWNDLIESKRSYTNFGKMGEEQYQRIAEIDRDFYSRTLNNYIT